MYAEEVGIAGDLDRRPVGRRRRPPRGAVRWNGMPERIRRAPRARARPQEQERLQPSAARSWRRSIWRRRARAGRRPCSGPTGGGVQRVMTNCRTARWTTAIPSTTAAVNRARAAGPRPAATNAIRHQTGGPNERARHAPCRRGPPGRRPRRGGPARRPGQRHRPEAEAHAQVEIEEAHVEDPAIGDHREQGRTCQARRSGHRRRQRRRRPTRRSGPRSRRRCAAPNSGPEGTEEHGRAGGRRERWWSAGRRRVPGARPLSISWASQAL